MGDLPESMGVVGYSDHFGVFMTIISSIPAKGSEGIDLGTIEETWHNGDRLYIAHDGGDETHVLAEQHVDDGEVITLPENTTVLEVQRDEGGAVLTALFPNGDGLEEWVYLRQTHDLMEDMDVVEGARVVDVEQSRGTNFDAYAHILIPVSEY